MPERSEVAYFGAGPAPLRTEILEEAAKALLNYNGTGLSLVEISHRSSDANKILADFTDRITKLLSIPDDYQVILAHGGGSGSFAGVVYNMVSVWVEQRRRQAEKELGASKKTEIIERVRKEIQNELRLDYLVTGSWSVKASQEATNLLEPVSTQAVNVAMDARKSNNGKFGIIPPEAEWKLSSKGSAMTYYCDNETVDGVEFSTFPTSLAGRGPDGESNVVADVSSNFLSRAIDLRNYAVIFGGAQKNIGITDLTVIIVRKSILENQAAPAFLHAVGFWSPPTIMNWATLAKNNSLYNTVSGLLPFLSSRVDAITNLQVADLLGLRSEFGSPDRLG
jgi:phosphoserine aminotransferase